MTTAQEVDEAARLFISCVRKLRAVQSPLTGKVTIYRP